MAAEQGTYLEYARRAMADYEKRDRASRYLLTDAVRHIEIKNLLDVGCGAGQELLPFLETTAARCFGVDAADGVGTAGGAIFEKYEPENRINFVRASGDCLPFADKSFEVVLCRVALPYMNNRRAISEIARVLRPGGVLLLKIHAPEFYFGMLKRRLRSFSLKQIAYPLICLAGGGWHQASGKQSSKGFWRGKEIYQTHDFLEREFARNNLRIKDYLPDTNSETPSFLVEKFTV